MKSDILFADGPWDGTLEQEQKCVLTPIVGKTTSVELFPQPSALGTTSRTEVEEASTQFDSDQKLAEKLKTGMQMLVRMNPQDIGEHAKVGEAYFVCKILEKPFQVMATATFNGATNVFERGDWVVKIEWYQMMSIDKRGHRHYKRLVNSCQVLSVKSFIRLGIRGKFKMVWCASSRTYVISNSLHDKIMAYSQELREVLPGEARDDSGEAVSRHGGGGGGGGSGGRGGGGRK